MLYGFAGAAITGFILTAIPNWTGRLPVSGWRLGALFALWSIGRIGFLVGDAISPWAIACLDFSFLFSLTVLIARELIAGKNWRNLPVLVLISLFTTGNFLFHLERTETAEMAETGMRLSTFVLAILIAVIGGRIVPSFTRNFLVKKGTTTLPAPISKFDTCSLVTLACFVIAKTAAPDHLATAGLALAAGLLHGVRLMRWKSWTILSEPLMWVLHLGYGWLVGSLLINAAAGFTDKVPAEAATHALDRGRVCHNDSGGYDPDLIGTHWAKAGGVPTSDIDICPDHQCCNHQGGRTFRRRLANGTDLDIRDCLDRSVWDFCRAFLPGAYRSTDRCPQTNNTWKHENAQLMGHFQTNN